MKALFWLGFLWILALNVASGVASKHKNVNVELHAKWVGTPLLMEMGELLAKERPDLFWKFVDKWLEIEPNLASENTEGCVKEILSQGTALVDGPLASILQLSLFARTSSPKLVLYRQLARESLLVHSELNSGDNAVNDRWTISNNLPSPRGKCCWVDVGSNSFLEEAELLDWLKLTSDRPLAEHDVDLFEFDHFYPAQECSHSLWGTWDTMFQEVPFNLKQSLGKG